MNKLSPENTLNLLQHHTLKVDKITLKLVLLAVICILLLKLFAIYQQNKWVERAVLKDAEWIATFVMQFNEVTRNDIQPIDKIEKYLIPIASERTNALTLHIHRGLNAQQLANDSIDNVKPDIFQNNAWQILQKNPQLPVYQFEFQAAQRYLRYIVPLMFTSQGNPSGIIEIRILLENTEIFQSLQSILLILVLIGLLGFSSLLFIAKVMRDSNRIIKTIYQHLSFNHKILQVQQLEMEERQYELQLANETAQKVTETLRAHTQTLEQNQRAMLNIMQDMDKARAEADAANRSKSEFLANMSHEIRTPMNGVLGMLSLALDTELSAQQREYLEIANSSGDTLLALINDILDYSKIEAGKMEFERIDFDVYQAVEEVVELLAPKAHTKGLELGTLFASNVPHWVNGDPTRFRQVVTNLVGNAIKFTETGEVFVHLALIEQNQQQIKLRCEIRDTGIGISAEGQRKIFQAFSQADGSTTRKYGGTGLGLTLSRKLVEHMGGEIGVHSELHKGSTFWFTIVFTAAAKTQPLLFPSLKIQGLHGLIVDDNATNRMILEHYFKRWEIRYSSCANGEQALVQLYQAYHANDAFHFAVIDMMMEGMDGLSLSHAIKKDSLLTSTRLIMLSSHAQRGDASDAHKVGFSAYLTKPLREGKLYDAIRLVMSLQKHQEDVLITRHTIEEQRRFHQQRILLVEDNIFNQKVALGMLRKHQLLIDIANNGREAVEATQNRHYDLIFMDCQMPVMDGYQATAVIRQLQAEVDLDPVPIIAMTANAMEGDREYCLTAGMDDYMTKPFKSERLVEILQYWLLDKPHVINSD